MTKWKNNNLLRERDYGTFHAEISYSVSEDSYAEGLIDNGESWGGKTTLDGESLSELFCYLSEKYGTSLDITDWQPYEDDEEDTIIITSTEVNRHMGIPTEEETERWEKGKVNLYLLDVWMEISEDCDPLSYKEITTKYTEETGEANLEDEYDEGFDNLEESFKQD